MSCKIYHHIQQSTLSPGKIGNDFIGLGPMMNSILSIQEGGGEDNKIYDSCAGHSF